MLPGIDTLTAAPMTIDIGGRQFRIAPLTLSDIGRLQAWINARHRAQFPDPVAIARQLAEGFPVEVQSELLREAYRDARDATRAIPSAPLGSAEADAIMGTTEGLVEVLGLGLRKHQPDMTGDDVAKLMESLVTSDIDRILSHAFGDDGGDFGPKAPAAARVEDARSTGPTCSAASPVIHTASTPMRSAG